MKSDPNTPDKKAREKLVSVVANAIRQAGLTNRTLLHSLIGRYLPNVKSKSQILPISFLTQSKHHADDIGDESAHHIMPNLDALSIPDEVKKAGGALWCPHFRDISKDQLLRAPKIWGYA